MKALLALAALASFHFAAAQKTTDIKSFNTLAVSGNIELTLIKSNANKIVIESGDYDKLKIGSGEGDLALSNDSDEEVKATVYFNGPIDNIAAAAGVSVTAKDEIKTKQMVISVAGGSEVNIKVDTDRLNVAIASGSEMKISGTAKEFEVAVASGAELHADSLKTEECTVVVASGGEAGVHANKTANATVASGGELKIHGNPKNVNKIEAEGAEITMVK
jgi:hypothetical protein